MSLQFDEHRQYLADAPRLAAYRAAIDATVRPGDVVVDLGCGTGILGLFACRAGASRVYAIDGGGMIAIAREVAAANGFADRIVHIAALSTRVELPERARVIVTDQAGRLGFEAGVIEYLADASRRFLAPGGRLIPESVTTWLAPVEAPELTTVVDFWQTTPGGFDFGRAHDGAVNTGYPVSVAAEQRLADGQPVLRFVCGEVGGAAVGTAQFDVTRAGVLSGLLGWFVADLTPEVTMTNAPGAPDQIARRQAFLPIGTPVRVEPGDVVEVTIRARPVEVVLAWQVRVWRGDRERVHVRHSTLRGMLMPREVLKRTDRTARPRLTAWAHARATVLHLCDGHHTLAEIEAETFSRHATLFPSAGAAQEFVAEVVTRYGRDD
jgi:Ribosomal protein L11 methyltransferase (PrmA)